MSFDRIEPPTESIGKESRAKANIDATSLLSQFTRTLKGEVASQDFGSALRGKIYPDKDEKATRETLAKPGSEAAMLNCGIKDMSKVDETKIPKNDVKQQAEWLLWKADETNPGKSGKLLIPIPRNFSDSIVDNIVSGSMKKHYEEEGYRNIRKGLGESGQKLLSVTRD